MRHFRALALAPVTARAARHCRAPALATATARAARHCLAPAMALATARAVRRCRALALSIPCRPARRRPPSCATGDGSLGCTGGPWAGARSTRRRTGGKPRCTCCSASAPRCCAPASARTRTTRRRCEPRARFGALSPTFTRTAAPLCAKQVARRAQTFADRGYVVVGVRCNARDSEVRAAAAALLNL